LPRDLPQHREHNGSDTGTFRHIGANAMASIPDDPNTLLTRQATAEALSAAGFPCAKSSLASMASRGGGPNFQKYGPRALYRWGDALEWAQSKLGPAIRSTAELDALRQHNKVQGRSAAN
jgi:hypothetical protein